MCSPSPLEQALTQALPSSPPTAAAVRIDYAYLTGSIPVQITLEAGDE